MTITYPLQIPLQQYAEVRWVPRTIVGERRSEFTGRRQVQVYPGQWWQAEVLYPTIGRDLAEPLTGFLLALNGREGTFLLGDPINTSPRGAAKNFASSPLINGVGQTGNALSVRNVPMGLTAWLLAGDFLQIGPDSRARLHKVTSQVDTDGNGLTTIDIWPALRSSPVDGEAVSLNATKGTFALNQSGAEWVQQPAFSYELGFSASEAF